MDKKLVFGILFGMMLLWNLVGCESQTTDFITSEEQPDYGLETESENAPDTDESEMSPEPGYIYV